MAAVTNATPLISLDAVVIDTETTGLDPRKARALELAAIRIDGGQVDQARPFQSFVNPGEPISAKVTAIHHIDAAKVARAPAFAEVWPQFSDFLGNTVVIGHTIGFDLAVLRRECERAGLPWHRPLTLDTQHLAQIVEPSLAGYSIEQIASWLGVEVTERHSALGDATTTARIFQAMVPVLRDHGIRTFAEASQACRALTDVLDKQHRAGWVTPEAKHGDHTERALSRLDAYPYRSRIREVMSAPPKFIAADGTLGEALALLIRDKISSLYVAPAGGPTGKLAAESAGIITERDILRALAIEGEGALKLRIEQFMSKPLSTIPSGAFVYRAIGRLSRLKLRHLGVIDDLGTLIGALSSRDLLRSRASDAVALGDEIDESPDIASLGRAWAKLPYVAASLLAEGVAARDIAAIISRELGALTRQAAVLAERRLLEEGKGAPPCDYVMTVLGSAGRDESLLAMDQDNAIVFERGEPEGPEDQWFATLGKHIADTLNEVGIPYCKGGVMASNAPWRGSVATWHARVADWIRRSNPQDLLSVDIFFDMRGVHGRLALADDLWRHAYDTANGKADFAKLLAETAGQVESSVGWFGNIRSTDGRIDLKRAGLFGIVSSARALAIRHHILERSTPARLLGIRALDIGGDQDLEALIEAQALFLQLILAQQLVDIQDGKPVTNAVALKRLTHRERRRLQRALQSLQHLDELTRDLLFKG